MLEKKSLEGRKVEVTFRMPPLEDVVELFLCGEFNGWQVKGIPLTVGSDGTWFARLVLDAGKSYRFRYHDNQGRWLNDREADAYVTNDFGSEDSVVDLTMPAEKPQTAKVKPKAKKKSPAPKGGAGGQKKTASGQRAKPKK